MTDRACGTTDSHLTMNQHFLMLLSETRRTSLNVKSHLIMQNNVVVWLSTKILKCENNWRGEGERGRGGEGERESGRGRGREGWREGGREGGGERERDREIEIERER